MKTRPLTLTERALIPFAHVVLPGDVNEKGERVYKGQPSGKAVFFYVGHNDGNAMMRLSDFYAARKALGLPRALVHRGMPGVPDDG